MPDLDFTQFDALTFDCYGTLIDWETGILAALRAVLERHGLEASDEELLAAFARHEATTEAGPYRRYRDVLAEALGAHGAAPGLQPDRDHTRSTAARGGLDRQPSSALGMACASRKLRRTSQV